MAVYWREFLTIAVVHLLAVASPGPDFAIVLRQSLRFGRRTALWTSCGIGCGLSVHVAYCLLGLGYVLKNSAIALDVIKYAGAAYLAWVGVQALRTPARSGDVDLAGDGPLPTARQAWLAGFLVNVLNPKAALFFISLFPLVVGPETPRGMQAFYGVWMAASTMAWFGLVSLAFTQAAVRRPFLAYGHWIDRALGLVFLALSLSLALASWR